MNIKINVNTNKPKVFNNGYNSFNHPNIQVPTETAVAIGRGEWADITYADGKTGFFWVEPSPERDGTYRVS